MTTSCPCICRQLSRFFERVLYGTGFWGKEDTADRLVFIKDHYTLDTTGWDASDGKFQQWLSKTFSIDGAEKVCVILHSCACCERHQKNKPQLFLVEATLPISDG